jgi:hypothetical protein
MNLIKSNPSPLGGTTTNETIDRDLRASIAKGRIEELLLELGYEDANAERQAMTCIAMVEPATYDAAIWRAAESLFMFMEGRGAELRLVNQPAKIRTLYVTLANQAVASFRWGVDGTLRRGEIEQAAADIMSHKYQLGQAVEAMQRRSEMRAVAVDLPEGA